MDKELIEEVGRAILKQRNVILEDDLMIELTEGHSREIAQAIIPIVLERCAEVADERYREWATAVDRNDLEKINTTPSKAIMAQTEAFVISHGIRNIGASQ